MLMQPEALEGQLVSIANGGINRQGRWLVRGVDLTIARGEIVTLIGPNGAGKSTTAKLAIGVLKPDEGAVARSPGLSVGYVPQKLSIDWTMPLNVQRLMQLTGKLKADKIMASLEAVGIPHLLKAEVQHLSGGEFQRALLARAIARDPDLLVLDEPVQGVDFAGETALYELIGTIRQKNGCGILMISHDLHMVMAGTDTVVCLNGHVCCRGTPAVVSQSDDYRRLFGTLGRGLAVYNHNHDHTHLPDGRVQHGDGSITDHCHPGDGHHHAEAHDHGHDHVHGDDHAHDHGRQHLSGDEHRPGDAHRHEEAHRHA